MKREVMAVLWFESTLRRLLLTKRKNMREIKFRGFNRKELFLAVGAFAFAQVIKDMEG